MPITSDPLAYALQRVDLFTEVDRDTVPITAIIRQPFEREDRSWLCAASISGLFHRKTDIERSSAEQAVRDARKYVLEELVQYQAEGGELCNAKGEPVVDLRAAVFRS